MPYKDPSKAKAQKRAYYEANKALVIRRNNERRAQIRAEKAAADFGPKQPIPRTCKQYGVDITLEYNPKHGANCKRCVAVVSKAYRQANKERIAAQKKAWVIANRDHVRNLERRYAVTNAENKTIARKKWAKQNPDKDRAAKAANRADRIMRVPVWADRERIKAYYSVCAFFNEVNGYAKYHVDHIIPLNGKTVSGLHVHNNLQVIPAVDNLRKGARYG